jgi:hypothetical protein
MSIAADPLSGRSHPEFPMRDVLLLLVLFTLGILRAEEVPLIDSADPAKEWKFDNGQEFPGAKGSLALDPLVVKDGKPGLRLIADLSGGGNYVSMSRNVEPLKLEVESVSFWIKAPKVEHLTMRLIDGGDRCHQINLGFDKPSDDWRLVSFPIQRFFEKRGTAEAVQGVSKYESWGGAKNRPDGWQGILRSFVILTGRPKENISIWIAGLVASVRAGTTAWTGDFEPASALPSGWRSEGAVSIATTDAFQGAHALVLSRTQDKRDQPCSVTSASFAVAPGVWEVGGAIAVDLESPDASYCGALRFDALDATGGVVESYELATAYGQKPWTAVKKQVRTPYRTASGRFTIKMEKTIGTVRIDALSAKPIDTSRKLPAVDRIVLQSAASGNLLLPEQSRVWKLTVETTRKLADAERVVSWNVRDYWGAEQTATATVTVNEDGKNQNRVRYTATVDLASAPLDVGRYYELHAQVPLADNEPFKNSSGFAIVPKAATKDFTPAQIPFTSRDWDNRIPAYIELSDRLGFRIIGLWAHVEPKPPYKAEAPGIKQCAELGAAILSGCPANLNSIEYHHQGWEQWTVEENIRGAIRSWFAAFGNHQPKPLMMNLGNEPHGKGEQVLQQVKAYKIAYDEIKKIAPDTIVIATAVEPNEEYFKAGYQDACDVFDFHIYERPEDIRRTIHEYRALMKQYKCEKPLWSTEIGLNSQGLTRQFISGDMARKFAAFFAEGGVNMNWFDLLYPDGDGKALGTSGDSFNLFDSRYNAYAARLDAVMCYNLINGICDKKFADEQVWADGQHGVLWRNEAGKCFAVLWKDAGRADVFLPLAGAKEVRVTRIDGRRSTLQAGGKGIGLGIGVDPILIAYDGAAKLPEKLDAAPLRITTAPPRLMRGAPGVIDLATTADPKTVSLSAPLGWTVTPDAKQPLRFTVTSPETSLAREGDLLVRITSADGAITAETSIRPVLTGRLAVEVKAQAAIAGSKPAVQVVVSNQSPQPQTITWTVSLTGERALVNGQYGAPTATAAFLADAGNGSLTIAGNTQGIATVPLSGIVAGKLYTAGASITDATGGVITVDGDLRDLMPAK